MRINRFAKISFIDFVKSNSMLLFQYFIFLISYVFGSLTVHYGYAFDSNDEINKCILDCLSLDFFDNLKSNFLFSVIVLCLMLLLSYYPFGAPLIVTVTALNSMGIGCLMSSVCRSYNTKGLIFNIITFLLPSILRSIIFAIFASVAIFHSCSLASIALFGNSPINFKQKSKDLLLLYLILVAASAFIAVIAAFLTIFTKDFLTN